MDDRVETSVHTSVLVGVLGLLAAVTGLPMLFPSLGPSAFLLAVWPERDVSNSRRVVVAHTGGVLAGFVGYFTFAGGLSATSKIVQPFSPAAFRLSVAAAVAILLTVGFMIRFGVHHPPACATTLIVALGLQSTPLTGAIIVLSVCVLVGVQSALVSHSEITGKLRDVSLYRQ